MAFILCFVCKKKKRPPSVPETLTERERSSVKKRDGTMKTTKWCFWKKKKLPPKASTEISSEAPKETPASANSLTLSGESANSLTLSGENANSLTLSGESANSVTLSGESANSLILSGESANSLTLPAESANSLTLSGESANSLTLSGESANSLILSGESANSLTLPAESANSLTLSRKTTKHLLNGGLPNLGCSCYVNASLQFLFRAETFCSELSYLLDSSLHGLNDTFVKCFVDLLKLTRGSEVKGSISKRDILHSLIKEATAFNPEFTLYQQSDAHEFVCYCLTKMGKTEQWQGWQDDVDPTCPVGSNFKFKMRNIITCPSCGSLHNRVEVCNQISVPLVHKSVDQCLYDAVNNPTVLERRCDVCGGESASSRWMFNTLPKFLILQLNRFRVTDYYTVDKLMTPVDIKPEMQINCISDMPGIKNSSAFSRDSDRNELERERQRDSMKDEGGSTSTYRLISILSHIGDEASYGHYLCDCSTDDPCQWVTYDDKLVTMTTMTKVLKKRSTSAYVLLFERVGTG